MLQGFWERKSVCNFITSELTVSNFEKNFSHCFDCLYALTIEEPQPVLPNVTTGVREKG